jgi:hypothetical protein
MRGAEHYQLSACGEEGSSLRNAMPADESLAVNRASCTKCLLNQVEVALAQMISPAPWLSGTARLTFARKPRMGHCSGDRLAAGMTGRFRRR